MTRPRLLVLVGPTASGKTALGCALAERLGGEIVSADSQQCYRGLDIGTAKPTSAERARAPHHLLDVAEPEDQLDAAQFIRLADAAIADIVGRGKVPLVVGGTGLWVRALLRGLLDAPGADEAFRAQVRLDVAREGVPALHARLASVDPESAARILPGDRVRIERALEVHALTGRPLSALQRAHRFSEARYPARIWRLDPPRALLRERIDARTRSIYANGALEAETRALLGRVRRLPAAARALKIIGYAECATALEAGGGPDAMSAARERTAARTRQYAKRQQTWFARDPAAEPLGWPIDAEGLSAQAQQWYAGAQ